MKSAEFKGSEFLGKAVSNIIITQAKIATVTVIHIYNSKVQCLLTFMMGTHLRFAVIPARLQWK